MTNIGLFWKPENCEKSQLVDCNLKVSYKYKKWSLLRRKYHFLGIYFFCQRVYPAGIYLLKVNNRNTRTRFEICSKLTIKTPCSSVSIINFEHVIAGWENGGAYENVSFV